MSARVLKFTGAWEGRFDPADVANAAAQTNAVNDARQIIAAKEAVNDWTSILWIALLASMDKPHLLRMELAVAARADNDAHARQALAMLRLANCGKEHRQRVMDAIDVLQGRGE